MSRHGLFLCTKVKQTQETKTSAPAAICECVCKSQERCQRRHPALSGTANYLSELANPVHFRSSHTENSISLRLNSSSSLMKTARKANDLCFSHRLSSLDVFFQQLQKHLKNLNLKPGETLQRLEAHSKVCSPSVWC